MPRLPPRLLRQAYSTNPALTRLLPICRDIRSAELELKWLGEHAARVSRGRPLIETDRLIASYITRRSRGEPLQIILKSEYFGELELKCRPDVLIPRLVLLHCFLYILFSDSSHARQETANSVTHLVHLLLSNPCALPSKLRVLDLCTGSGCVPLLFNHEFYKRSNDTEPSRGVDLDILGVDISIPCIKLAQENQRLQLHHLKQTRSIESQQHKRLEAMRFLQANVLEDEEPTSRSVPPLQQALQRHHNSEGIPECDILISNPPYISPKDYYRTTSPSVRNYEPKSALVPPIDTTSEGKLSKGDIFYHHILRHAQQLNTKILLVEVADLEQAKRVVALMVRQGIWSGVEIWRDHPDDRSGTQSASVRVEHDGATRIIPIVGSGNGRSVLAFRGECQRWLAKLIS